MKLFENAFVYVWIFIHLPKKNNATGYNVNIVANSDLVRVFIHSQDMNHSKCQATESKNKRFSHTILFDT